MLLIKEVRFFRKPKPAAPAPLPPVGPVPVLRWATYDPVGLVVVLGFDRAVDIDGLDGYAITVADGAVNHAQYVASGTPLLLGPAVVRLALGDDGESSGPDTRLWATEGNGIVAASDGAAWPGAGGVVIPFS